jgi:hypothetical protein
MATDFESACDAILSTLKVQWDADTTAVAGAVPALVYEAQEPDLKPHPRDSALPWARVVLRHTGARKATLNNDEGTARYRRTGFVWLQVFAPADSEQGWTLAQRLAMIGQKAYEGKRAAGGEVVFTTSAILDRPKSGNWFQFDVKTEFYWDEIR